MCIYSPKGLASFILLTFSYIYLCTIKETLAFLLRLYSTYDYLIIHDLNHCFKLFLLYFRYSKAHLYYNLTFTNVNVKLLKIIILESRYPFKGGVFLDHVHKHDCGCGCNHEHNKEEVQVHVHGGHYSGEKLNGKMHGEGTYFYNDGSKYVGQWENDLMHGHGILTWANGEKYIGEWKDDLKHGNGIYIWPDGESYVGEWKNDLKHGHGIYSWQHDEKAVGIWSEDELIEE